MASATDVFARASNGTRPTPTTLTAILASGSSPGTATCAALTGWPTTSKVHFCIYTINTSGAKVAGSQTDWVGVVSGSTITGLTLKAGTNVGYSVGAVVEASPIAAYADDLFAGLTAEHNASDGKHAAITATSLITTAAVTVGSGLTVSAGSVTVPNNSITAAALSTSSITLGTPVTITAGIATSSGTATQAVGLSITVTIPAGGRGIEIELFGPSIYNSTTNTSTAVSIWDGVVGSGTQLQEIVFTSATAAAQSPLIVKAFPTPSAGSKTYNIGYRAVGGGAANITASATAPVTLLVRAR